MFCRQNVISHMFPDMFQLLYFFGGIRMLIGLNLSEMFLLQVKKTASSRSNVLESHHSLVGGLEHLLFFHIFARIIPTDFHIFQRGGSTTNQFLFFHKALSVDHEDHQEITILKCSNCSLPCWLVVLNMAGLCSISYMGCHPPTIDELSIIFQDGVFAPPTSSQIFP